MSLSSRLRGLVAKVFGRHEGEEAADLMEAELLTLSGGTMTGNVVYTPSAITYAASIALNFDGVAIQTLTLTGDVTLTTSNRATGKSVLVKLLASGGVRTFTSLPSWVWVGGTAPASLASGKTALLSLTCFGTAETDIVAAYAVES